MARFKYLFDADNKSHISTRILTYFNAYFDRESELSLSKRRGKFVKISLTNFKIKCVFFGPDFDSKIWYGIACQRCAQYG